MPFARISPLAGHAPLRRWGRGIGSVGLTACLGAASLGLAATPAAAADPASAVTPSPPGAPVRQSPPALPAHSVVLGHEAAGRSLDLTVYLTPSDPAGLTRLADAVSDPASAQYHRFLPAGAFTSRFGAPAAEVGRVRQELRAAGMQPGSLAPNHLSLSVRTTTAGAERLFHTSIHSVRASGRTAFANTTTAVLPAGVSAVAGLDDLVRAHDDLATAAPHSAATLPPTLCSATGQRAYAYSPAQVAAAYSFGGAYAVADGTGTTVALMELADYSASDLATFESCLGLTGQSVQRVPVDGGAAVGDGTSEATYDIEQVMATAPGAAVLVYESTNDVQGLLDVYTRMIADDRAAVISTSWGLCEALDDPTLMHAENTLFQQAAVQGQTILAASGDSGSEDCYAVDQDRTLQVDDPASQPYVTGVGGTSLTSISPRTETVWNSGGGAGGGGISGVFPMPSWQQSAVTSESSGAPCGARSGDCRQVPDVSASADPAHGYAGYCTAGDCSGSGWRSTGGTSLAAPLWASIVALADQACPTNHRAGFINPVLYKSAAAANDVTVGSNDLLGVHAFSFRAGPGYDMATGLGSPSATALVPLLCVAAATPGSGTGSGSSGGSGTSPTGGTTPPAPTGSPAPPTGGPPVSAYRFAAADGGVFNFGSAAYLGSAGGVALKAPIVGMAVTPDGAGYWLVASDGGVFSYGDAVFYGSAGALHLAAPIVGMAATPDGAGYWLVAADGGIFNYGDAAFHGSAGALHLAKPIVGMAADPATGGYWLVAADGGIFSFGAPFDGSTGALHLAAPIVGMSASPDGSGYRFVARDGGIFSFGSAAFFGSTGALHLSAPVVGMSTTADGLGYWLVAADGGVFSFGDASFLGSTGGLHLAAPIVGVAAA
jgi:hypothetical protein